VLIQRIEESSTFSGSRIVKPDSAKQELNMGKVLAISAEPQQVTVKEGGSRSWEEPVVGFKVGDTVIFGDFSGHNVHGKKDQVLVAIEDVLGVVEQEEGE